MNKPTLQKTYLHKIVILFFVLIVTSLSIFQFVVAKGTPKKPNCEGLAIEMFRTQAALIPPSDVVRKRNNERTLKAWEKIIGDCENRTAFAETVAGVPQLVQATPITSITAPTSIPSVTPTDTPGQSGIFDDQPGAFFHSYEAKIQNHWQGSMNGYNVTVFAGAWFKDPDQGFLAVMLSPTHGHAIWGTYPSPNKSGALRIVDAIGYRLIVQQANDSNLLYFDVPAQVYVSSLDATVTPGAPTSVVETTQPTSIPPYPYPITDTNTPSTAYPVP